MKTEAKVIKLDVKRDSVKSTEPRKSTAMKEIKKAFNQIAKGVYLF